MKTIFLVISIIFFSFNSVGQLDSLILYMNQIKKEFEILKKIEEEYLKQVDSIYSNLLKDNSNDALNELMLNFYREMGLSERKDLRRIIILIDELNNQMIKTDDE